jgi:hypothetical protein
LQVADDLDFIRGKHQVSIGANWIHNRIETLNNRPTNGQYTFSGQSTGLSLADFMVGAVSGGFLQGNPVYDYDHSDYMGAYVQDNWRVRANLLLNLGLRWEYTTPWAEKFGQIGNFLFDAKEPITGNDGNFKFLDPGQYAFNPDKKRFGPRVGLAYRATTNTVFRMSAGIFYAPNDSLNAGTSDWGNGLYLLNESILGPPNPIPNTPPVGGSWSNPFAGGLVKPDRTTTFEGQNIRAYNRGHVVPYVSNWSFNIQRMITSTLLVEAGYVGSKITHLAQNRFYNQNNPLLLPLGPALLEQVPNPYFGKIKSGTLSFPTVQRRQLLRPFPQFIDINARHVLEGKSRYNAAIFQFTKRMSHGVGGRFSYTWSRLDDSQFGQGSLWVLPGLHQVHRFSIRDQVYRPTKSSKADGEAPFQSLEGLSLGVDLSVRYAVDPSRVTALALIGVGLGSTILATLVIRSYSGAVSLFDVRYGASLGAGPGGAGPGGARRPGGSRLRRYP